MIVNEGTTDRAIRVVDGLAAVAVALTVGIGSLLGIVLVVVGAVLLLTGAVGFCPLYRVFGLSTCPIPADKR